MAVTQEAAIADVGITTGDTVVSGTVSCDPGEWVFFAVDVRDETDTWTVAWTGGGAFTQIVDLNAARSQGGMTVFSYYNNSGSTITDTITATSVGNTHPATINGSVWSGVDTTDWGNYSTAVTSGSDNANLTGSITPEADDSVVVAFAGTRGDNLTLQGDETMIEEGTTYGAGGDRVTLDHFRKNGTHSSGGSVTVGGTASLSGVCDWRLVILALKPATGPVDLPPGGVLSVPQAVARASRW